MNWEPLVKFAQMLFSATDHFITSHSKMIVTGFVATLLTIYGNRINGAFREWTRKSNVLIRFLAFILLCTLGYAFLTDLAMEQSERLLHWAGPSWRVGVVLGGFTLLAILARRERQL
jgi:hypothetical protein